MPSGMGPFKPACSHPSLASWSTPCWPFADLSLAPPSCRGNSSPGLCIICFFCLKDFSGFNENILICPGCPVVNGTPTILFSWISQSFLFFPLITWESLWYHIGCSYGAQKLILLCLLLYSFLTHRHQYWSLHCYLQVLRMMWWGC